MDVIRVNFVPEFHLGDDVVLLTMDGAGLDRFKAALSEAARQGSSRLAHTGINHEFRIQAGAADIELDDNRVVWRLDHAKAVEIIEDLVVLSDKGGAGHHYVDTFTPAETLILSRDEYVDVVFPS